ncbi:MAG TPA: type II secretion system F family protein [Syntrophobacteraceae bacterium]|nr:type II secretion system F family protein [Syntrophobacteraceae bacterium]
MGYFQYQARDLQGTVHKGILEALSEPEAARKLKSSKLYPVKIKAIKSRRPRRVPEEHVIRFFFDLSDLLSAGLPVDRALALISTNQTHKVFRQVVQDLLEEVQGGMDLSGAIGKYRDVFGELSDHMVRAGEASATLGPITRRLAQHLEQRKAFRQNLVSSMIYPCILLGTSAISIVILLVYVIPKFAQIFKDLNQEVPFLTQMLLQAGVLLKEYGWVFPLLLAVGFWGGRHLYRQPKARRIVDRLLFRIPFTRNLILNSELTRFCRTLGTMIQAGVPLMRALTLGHELLINSVLKEAIAPVHREIKAGKSMSNFFRTHQPFPGRMGTMLRIAEEQGNLGDGLLGLGDHFEGELQRRIHRVMILLEPAVIVSTALGIGTMVLSMFSAIFGINEIQF